MNRKDELKSILQSARTELMEIEDAEKISKNKQYVGKFFKYRNSYSCPKDNEYWWLYTAITEIDDNGILIGWNFQKDIYEKFEIEKDISFYPDGHAEISKEEFYDAFLKITEDIDDLLAKQLEGQ